MTIEIGSEEWYERLSMLDATARDNIIEHGQHLVGVMGGPAVLPFTYTVGNHARGLPELVSIGSAQGYFLNEVSEALPRLIATLEYVPGEVYSREDLLGGVDIAFEKLPAGGSDRYPTSRATRFWGDGYELWALHWAHPDKGWVWDYVDDWQSYMPGDPEFRPNFPNNKSA